jgi:arsenate reductase
MNPPFRVLWICTANACRSQIAEAVLRHLGGERFVSRSAGVNPVGWIHPLAQAGLASLGIPLGDQRSKSCQEVLAIAHDIIITVCDAAACQIPSGWQGNPIIVHWSLPDPVMHPGTEEDRRAAAVAAAHTVRDWIERFVSLPLETMDRDQVRAELQAIGSASQSRPMWRNESYKR